MKKYNIAYPNSTSNDNLKVSLSSLGTVVDEKVNLRIVRIESDRELADIQAAAGPGAIVEEDTSIQITPHFEWHQLRITTTNLPLKTIYPVFNHGDGAVVYLVDSGINKSHPELVGSNIVDLYSQIAGDFSDTGGHGTAMASLINGQTVGVSKNATVKNVKVVMSGNILISDLLNAFEAILNDHILSPSVKVVNCSWTIPKSLMIDTKISELQNSGLVVVAAAGNTAEAANNFSPVGLNTVIGVAASDAYDRVINWAPGVGSNWGPEVDITAPGIDVPCASLSTNGIDTRTGTSVAAAVVSGTICQFIYDNPVYTALQIQNEILAVGLVDRLFRNETVYGTTPNLLLQALYVNTQNAWDPPVGTMFTAKRGQQTQFQLNVTQKIQSVTYEQSTIPPNAVVVPFDWITVSLSGTVNTIQVTPPADLPVGKYTLFLEAKTFTDVVIWSRFVIGVYDTSPTELNTVQVEQYQTLDETGSTVIKITTAFCTGPGQCPKSAPFCCNAQCNATSSC